MLDLRVVVFSAAAILLLKSCGELPETPVVTAMAAMPVPVLPKPKDAEGGRDLLLKIPGQARGILPGAPLARRPDRGRAGHERGRPAPLGK